MTTKVEAIYENGSLKLSHPLPLQDKTRVFVVVQSEADGVDAERGAWLRLSEETLTKAWDNPADDVFNELLNG